MVFTFKFILRFTYIERESRILVIIIAVNYCTFLLLSRYIRRNFSILIPSLNPFIPCLWKTTFSINGKFSVIETDSVPRFYLEEAFANKAIDIIYILKTIASTVSSTFQRQRIMNKQVTNKTPRHPFLVTRQRSPSGKTLN